MPIARDLNRLLPRLLVWQEYDSTIKAELFSSAIMTADGLYIIDPIPLATECLAQLTDLAPVSGVIVTNSNHRRAASDYANTFVAPIFAHAESFASREFPGMIEIDDGQRIGSELEVVTIDGAPPGEIALYHSANGGTLIVGDALINFEPYGFTFLPPKYCRDAKEMRRSLRKLLASRAERLLFAHGTPILSGAETRLQQLLDVDR
jgi:glyoxylase-like metal-dependent hydrolase (beta-lactamase superfamily II)